MIPSILELPPLGSRIAVEQTANDVRFIVPAASLARRARDCVRFIVLSLLAAGLLFLLSSFLSGWLGPVVFLILAPVPFLLIPIVGHIHAGSMKGSLTVSPGQLVVCLSGILGSQRLVWRREQIQAIAAWKSLGIASMTGHITELLSGRDLNELAWLARALCQVLQVSAVLPARPGELVVSYRGAFWNEPVTGLLRIQPGEMTLRHTFAKKPHLRFRTGNAYLNSMHDAVTLVESDLSCRIEDDGSACLRIAPEGVSCQVRDDGRPQLDIALLGPVCKIRIFPDAVVGKRNLSSSERDFHLTIWSDDRQALQNGLARFWGNRDRD